jgi:hypothetical protein
MATGFELDSRGVGVLVPVGEYFSLLHVVETGSGAHPASYPMGNLGPFGGCKAPVREVEHSFLTSDEVKKAWIYTSTPPYVFIE